jgi:hypothetical protein
MSDFQIGMILAGVAIVGGVFGLNWWQERSFRRKAEQAFEKPAQDVLLEPKPKTAARASSDTQRLEPSLSMPVNPVAAPRTAVPQPPVPGAGNTIAASRVDPVLESVVDFIADFVLVEPVPAHKLLVAIEDAGQLGKPVRWMGLIDERRLAADYPRLGAQLQPDSCRPAAGRPQGPAGRNPVAGICAHCARTGC